MPVRKAYTPEELRELAAEPLDAFHPHLLAVMRGALRFSADVIEAANAALRPQQPTRDDVEAEVVTDAELAPMVESLHRKMDVLRAAQSTISAEQQARDMLERIGVEGAQNFSAGDLVELANLINDSKPTMVKVGTVSSLMGNFCVIKLDHFTVRKGDTLYAAKDTP